MKDQRITQLAQNLINYSIEVKKGERVLLHGVDVPDDIMVELVRAVRAKKAHPHVKVQHSRVQRAFLMGCTAEQLDFQCAIELEEMKGMDGYVAVRGAANIFETSDVPSKDMQRAMGAMRPVLNWRVNNTKWVGLRWPSASMAQQSGMSTEAFEDFYFDVCCMDYARMLPGQRALKKAMDAAEQVRIVGPGTDLRFSIKGLEAIMCAGKRNIPDGEVFTAPVRDSVEGVLSYNVPTVYQGVSFSGVRLEFEKGRIVKATAAANQKKLRSILASDEGAAYIGEFAIGFNPHILEPMQDILFDEKIAGSFHFTPGQAYEGVADNGNRSQVHWDMVCIQRPDYGGGEIWFDGKLIRKDGLFVPKALQKLNPDYLLAQ